MLLVLHHFVLIDNPTWSCQSRISSDTPRYHTSLLLLSWKKMCNEFLLEQTSSCEMNLHGVCAYSFFFCSFCWVCSRSLSIVCYFTTWCVIDIFEESAGTATVYYSCFCRILPFIYFVRIISMQSFQKCIQHDNSHSYLLLLKFRWYHIVVTSW